MFSTTDTAAVNAILSTDDALYMASCRVKSHHALENLVKDAAAAGVWFNGADLDSVDYEKIYDEFMWAMESTAA